MISSAARPQPAVAALTFVCLCTGGAKGAEIGDRAAESPFEEIVVTATRIERPLARVPAAVSVLARDDIQLARQQLALDESLSRVPGIFVQNRFNFAQDLRVSIRGFGARAQFGIRGVKVLVDGIPETLPDGQGSVDSIDLGATSRIEVIRGPSSSLYGNASGGVISIVTEGGGEERFAEARITGGAFDFRKVQLKAGGQAERVNYLVSVSDSDYGGYRDHGRAKSRQLTSRLDFDLGEERGLLAVLNFTDQPVADDPGGLTAPLAAANPRAAWPGNAQFLAGEALRQTRLGFVYSMPLAAGHEITARNYYAWRDFENALPGEPGALVAADGIVDLDRQFVGGGFSYHYDGFWLDRPNRLVVGIDYDGQDDERRRFDNLRGTRGALTFDQNEHVRSRGIFLQNQLSITPRVELTLGARTDRVEFEITDRFLADGRDDSGTLAFADTSPMAGLTIQLTADANLYATYSSAFETPTTTELNRRDAGGGFNPDLAPQTARSLEVGLRGALAGRHRYELALFTIDVDDELIPFEVPSVPGRNYFQNAGKSERKGLEVSLVARPTERLQATLSYTYSDFTFAEFRDAAGDDFAGNVIPGTAESVLFGEVVYTHPRRWFAAIDVLAIDEQFGDNANAVAVDGYVLANVRLGYDFERGPLGVSPFVGVNNAGGEEYTANVRLNAFGGRYFEPGPGRNGYAGVTLRYRF